MAAIRVILADDHAVVRKGIRDFLEEDGDIEVIAETGDGEKAKDLIQSLLPDVAILDVRMPGATGIDVARWVRAHHLPVHILILTAYDDDPVVIAALQAGSDGYMLKTADGDAMTAAVRAVHAGQPVLAPEIAKKMMTHMAGGGRHAQTVDALSDREREVLQLAAAGLTNRGIGVKLSISDRTVQGHLASTYTKLQVNSRTEAVTRALQLGLIRLPEQKS